MKIKYIIFSLVFAICAFIGASAAEAPIRIGLSYASTAKTSVKIYSDGGFETTDALDLGTYIIATNLEGNIVLSDSTGATVLYQGTSGQEVKVVTRSNMLSIDDKLYRGNVVFKPYNGKITVINEIMVDDYLCGVVAGEMPASWPFEALKAQAVAARCFAFDNLGKHSSYGFDLCATTNCQVYGGVASEKESTNRAVAETAGIVAVADGKIINALYTSSNGGYAEASENVWGGKVSYFQTFKDDYEKTDEISRAVWKVELTPEEIKAELLDNGVDIGDIIGMEIVNTSESGRVLEVKITGTTGTKSYTKSYARTFLGLRSQLYTITPPYNAALNCLSANGQQTVSGDYYVLTANGIQKRTTGSGNGKYIITGRGYGHGVGMSQWGAYYMAQQGLNYVDILTYYYKGVQIMNYTDVIS